MPSNDMPLSRERRIRYSLRPGTNPPLVGCSGVLGSAPH